MKQEIPLPWEKQQKSGSSDELQARTQILGQQQTSEGHETHHEKEQKPKGTPSKRKREKAEIGKAPPRGVRRPTVVRIDNVDEFESYSAENKLKGEFHVDFRLIYNAPAALAAPTETIEKSFWRHYRRRHSEIRPGTNVDLAADAFKSSAQQMRRAAYLLGWDGIREGLVYGTFNPTNNRCNKNNQSHGIQYKYTPYMQRVLKRLEICKSLESILSEEEKHGKIDMPNLLHSSVDVPTELGFAGNFDLLKPLQSSKKIKSC